MQYTLTPRMIFNLFVSIALALLVLFAYATPALASSNYDESWSKHSHDWNDDWHKDWDREWDKDWNDNWDKDDHDWDEWDDGWEDDHDWDHDDWDDNHDEWKKHDWDDCDWDD